MDGKRSISDTWDFITENVSFKPVKKIEWLDLQVCNFEQVVRKQNKIVEYVCILVKSITILTHS